MGGGEKNAKCCEGRSEGGASQGNPNTQPSSFGGGGRLPGGKGKKKKISKVVGKSKSGEIGKSTRREAEDSEKGKKEDLR